jgi:hypothetical protein
MGWFLFLFLIAIGVPVFMRVYGRRLDVLTGPWIANETSQNE